MYPNNFLSALASIDSLDHPGYKNPEFNLDKESPVQVNSDQDSYGKTPETNPGFIIALL